MQSPTEKRVLDEIWPIIEELEQKRSAKIALEGLKMVGAEPTAEQTFEEQSEPEAEA